ncbi:hypothetical protein DLM86_25520 [Paenibacillus flagellatus]|uniref:HTH lysR-type domain-containing protein n=1 Tax=Paenibacillus flagellatus TaxID=2211139 RepID=A0A2V5JYQ0_9BACL|nr:hypothetical protein DLM86_25520 [Paenibacillus flagellatus]
MRGGLGHWSFFSLKYFRTVARLEPMTEAAGELYITQSSLSKTIQRLEEDLGASLFDRSRSGRKFRLNEFGHCFLQRVERALFELEEGRREIADMTGAGHGTPALAVNTAYMREQQASDVQPIIRNMLHRFKRV